MMQCRGVCRFSARIQLTTLCRQLHYSRVCGAVTSNPEGDESNPETGVLKTDGNPEDDGRAKNEERDGNEERDDSNNSSRDDSKSVWIGRVRARRWTLILPTVSPPQELQTTLRQVFSRYPSKNLTLDGEALSEHLLSRKIITKVDESKKRKGEVKVVSGSPWTVKPKHRPEETTLTVVRYGKREAVAYAASRLQATYGATLRVLSEIARKLPSFQPQTLLDFGSGLGTATWAAHQLWGQSLYEYQCVDSSQEMEELARTLRQGGMEGVYFRQYLPVSNKVRYDIVVAAYALGDIPTVKLRRFFIASLWRKTTDFLVLIEHGNQAGFNIIIEARDMVLKATGWKKMEYYGDGSGEPQDSLEGHVFAPCPHDTSCPLAAEKSAPCHFGQRVQLAFREKNSPLKHKGFRIENFSYVVLRKGSRPEQVPQGRLLQPVKKRSRHIICKLCCSNGEAKQIILTKSKHGDLYKQGRHSEWGDVLPLPDTNQEDRDLTDEQSDVGTERNGES